MAHARHAERAFPQVGAYITIVAALLVSGTLALFAFEPLKLQGPTAEVPPLTPALVEAGQQWELQRKAEMGYVDPIIDSGRDWEEQRRQQSGE